MQQRHGLRQKTGTELNITPMIDVIFILLIFFLATTSFVKETGVEVERPSAATAEHQERGNILIAISENGEIWMGNHMLDIRSVRANVERALAENPEGTVIITADKASRTGLLVQVMDQARLAGVSSVSIAAIKE
jgi:biopolymer transport protein ExbD